MEINKVKFENQSKNQLTSRMERNSKVYEIGRGIPCNLRHCLVVQKWWEALLASDQKGF